MAPCGSIGALSTDPPMGDICRAMNLLGLAWFDGVEFGFLNLALEFKNLLKVMLRYIVEFIGCAGGIQFFESIRPVTRTLIGLILRRYIKNNASLYLRNTLFHSIDLYLGDRHDWELLDSP